MLVNLNSLRVRQSPEPTRERKNFGLTFRENLLLNIYLPRSTLFVKISLVGYRTYSYIQSWKKVLVQILTEQTHTSIPRVRWHTQRALDRLSQLKSSTPTLCVTHALVKTTPSYFYRIDLNFKKFISNVEDASACAWSPKRQEKDEFSCTCTGNAPGWDKSASDLRPPPDPET